NACLTLEVTWQSSIIGDSDWLIRRLAGTYISPLYSPREEDENSTSHRDDLIEVYSTHSENRSKMNDIKGYSEYNNIFQKNKNNLQRRHLYADPYIDTGTLTSHSATTGVSIRQLFSNWQRELKD
ncbi:Hypothetical predicted protein, partial [Pelobates cultripes]